MENVLSVRLAVTSECSALEALQRRASLRNPGDRAALLANPGAIVMPPEQIAAGQVFVAERDAAIVGFAAVLPRADGDTELDGLFVEPEIWKSGIGRALVERCCVWARANGAAALHVIGNPHATGFYEACGFKITGTHHTQFKPALRMRKDL